MISLKQFFRQKMARLVLIFFAGILFVANIVIFTMSSVQYEIETNRQKQAFEAMMVHLITMESTDTAITYIEHYNHTQGINIAFYDASGALLYETTPGLSTGDLLTLKNDQGQTIGTVLFDDQNSYLGSDLTLGLILMNVFSILIFLVFMRLLYGYLNRWYQMIEQDLSRMGRDTSDFHFNDLSSVSEKLYHSMATQTRMKEYQKEYVKMLAHDIKTPLTVIKAYLEGIQTQRLELDDVALKEMLAEVDEIEHMIPKFMTDNVDTVAKKQNIRPIIEAVVNRLSEVFQTKDMHVKTELDDYTMTISYLDIARITEHLLFNAFYYTPASGTISIQLDANQNQLVFEDNGIGMDEETLKRIQEGPYRSPTAKKMQAKGSGIGLQIVQETLKRLGLGFGIKSQPGSGTTLTIHLNSQPSQEKS